MGPVARASAVSNFLFNLTGLVLYLPFLPWFSRWVVESSPEPGLAVAWAHLVFNLSIGLAFLATLRWLEPVLRLWLLPDGDPADAGRGERT
jgi:Na+/phosphate symporter